MNILRFIFATAFFLMSVMPMMKAEKVSPEQAKQVGTNYLLDKTAGKSIPVALDLQHIETHKGENSYYVFNNSKTGIGFVIVSADDNYYPVIGYSLNSEFRTDNMPKNVAWWMENYEKKIEYAKNNEVKSIDEIKKQWERYRADNFSPQLSNVKGVEPLVGHILWNQDAGWNDACPADDAGPGGHALAGCVATAMGIILKYWEHPVNGYGSHDYYIWPYGTLAVDYTQGGYFWNLMPDNSPNIYTATLLYHLGVSVDMGYGPDGSGTQSSYAPAALKEHFGISEDCHFVDRVDYTNSQWIDMLKTEINAGQPVYYSGYDSDMFGHAFVCSGYDDSDYFHYNFGWSGYNNGFYTIDDVGGFPNGNGAILDFVPGQIQSYMAEPPALSAEIDDALYNFKVNLSWDAPLTKAVTGYKIYRDGLYIGETDASTTTFVDDAEVGDYAYAVQAIYDNGISLGTHDEVEGFFRVTFRVHDADGNLLTNNSLNPQVTFNGQTNSTGFGSTSFSNVPFGGQRPWSAVADGYNEQSGAVDVASDFSHNIYLTEVGAFISQSGETESLKLFPVPAQQVLNIDTEIDISKKEFSLHSINGKQIARGTLSGDQINISYLNNGLYFLKIRTNDGIITKSFIKK